MIPTQVTPNRQNYVEIGKIYENLVTEVVFSVPDLGDGTGSYTVVFQRPKEAAPYPVAARVEWPNVIWEVGAADTAKSGTGKAEVRWYGDDGEVGKSKTFVVRVNAGLADPTDAPEPWEGYVGRVARNAETAETAAADAAASAQSAGADAVKAEAALKALEDGIASGDFRGEDGAVPNIQIGTVTTLPAGSNATASMGGTAENPLLNLGIPKGADGQGSGSGGTDISLGLTSATVGQTIKVKAVDTDGKPTAWEAADLPAGAGETWQFITEITLDDAVNVVTINKDANGNSFALKRVMIDCVIKLNTDDPFTTINTKLNGFVSASNASPTSNTLNPRYYSFYAEIIPGSGALCWHVCNGTNYNWGSDMLKMGYKYNNLWQSDAITSLTIQANDGYKNIGLAGTKINVLGVRA